VSHRAASIMQRRSGRLPALVPLPLGSSACFQAARPLTNRRGSEAIADSKNQRHRSRSRATEWERHLRCAGYRGSERNSARLAGELHAGSAQNADRLRLNRLLHQT